MANTKYNPAQEGINAAKRDAVRIDIIKGYETHPWLKKTYAKLTRLEMVQTLAFAQVHAHLSKDDFMMAVQRMFLDRDKPKHWKEIQELLTCANSAMEE